MDGLTGILKKNIAEIRITSMLSEDPGGTLFLCDMDNLRRINDQYGHLAGDECLKEAAQILMYMIRTGDIFGRRGGDEFRICRPGWRDAGQAEELKESVRQAACLEEAMEAELARTGRAAQTARQIKARVGKLRDALGVFRLR